MAKNKSKKLILMKRHRYSKWSDEVVDWVISAPICPTCNQLYSLWYSQKQEFAWPCCGCYNGSATGFVASRYHWRGYRYDLPSVYLLLGRYKQSTLRVLPNDILLIILRMVIKKNKI